MSIQLYVSLNETLQIPASAALIRLAPAARSPPPEADAHQSRREGSLNLRNELQLGARRAVPRGLEQQSGARDASARQRRRPARRVQSPTRHVSSIHVECVSHKRLEHTARVFERRTIDGERRG